jgi:16S rRNA (guanine966-N2)-methyltransferase
MRVVAGTLGSRRLRVPPGDRATLRPTSERVRAAMFNSLGSLGAIDDARVWDLFAGSGALGIEALSRGASEATFVDQDRGAVATIRENLATLGLAGAAKVVCDDVPRWIAQADPADLVLVDPPYAFEGWATLLPGVRADVVVCESNRPIGAVGDWEVTKILRHGGTVVTLMQPRGVAAT